MPIAEFSNWLRRVIWGRILRGRHHGTRLWNSVDAKWLWRILQSSCLFSVFSNINGEHESTLTTSKKYSWCIPVQKEIKPIIWWAAITPEPGNRQQCWFIFEDPNVRVARLLESLATISKWFSVCDSYSQTKRGLYLLNDCNGSFLIIFTMRNFNFRIGTYSGDTLWSLSWVKSSQLDLYNTDSGIDATGDWALSLTAVSQQGEDAKAKSRSMNLQARWFHQTLINPMSSKMQKISNPLEMATAC